MKPTNKGPLPGGRGSEGQPGSPLPGGRGSEGQAGSPLPCGRGSEGQPGSPLPCGRGSEGVRRKSSSDFLPLFCRSGYSFLKGASQPAEFAQRCQELGYGTFGLCDLDGVYGIVRGWKAAREAGLGYLCGAQVALQDGPSVYLLAQDLQGWGNLCQLLSLGRERASKGQSLLYGADLPGRAAGLLLVHPDLAAQPSPEPLLEAFEGRCYNGIARVFHAGETARIQGGLALARRFGLPSVAAHPAWFHVPERKILWDLMRAIDLGLSLEEAQGQMLPNSRSCVPTPQEARALYSCFPGALRACRELAERCTFAPSQLTYRYPSEMVPPGRSSQSWLEELVTLKAAQRYPQGVPAQVQALLAHELALIAELAYADYFLTMHDIVASARAKNILCQGRGSAANSAVCFVLGITSVDPARISLLFERFISRERAEPPDIDVDFEHERREEVIQDIYQRYGSPRAAMICEFIRYRRRLALRDTGRALGFSRQQCDHLGAAFHSHRRDGHSDQEILLKAGLDPTSQPVQLLLQLSAQLCGFPRHLSIHTGGFLISDTPVRCLVPVEPARMSGRSVIQWDKNDIEDTGLLKVDILALGMLTAIRKGFDLVRSAGGPTLALHSIPEGDEPTYKMIRKADTVGVFQIESRAQMSVLSRLQPRNYYDLVVQVAIVRPGPIQGGMIQPYLRRRAGLEPVEYPAPELAPILARTYGVPLFQEQVLRLAMAAGGFSPGQAEELRRAMGTFRTNGRLEPMLEQLKQGMSNRGITDEYASRILAQIRGFGEYGFPESHAASFALLSYVSSYLKCHHQAAFAGALINSQPMGFYSVHSILQDALRHGVPVLPPDLNASAWDCTVAPLPEGAGGLSLRLGLRVIKGLERGAAEELLAQRTRGGPFADMDELVARCPTSPPLLLRLALAGALDGLFPQTSSPGRRRAAAIWSAHRYWESGAGLFDATPREAEGPQFPGMNEWDLMLNQFRRTAYSVQRHPLEFFRQRLVAEGYQDSRQASVLEDGAVFRCGGLIITRQRPGTAKGMLFLTLEDEFGFLNLAVDPAGQRRFGDVLLDESLVGLKVRLGRVGEARSMKAVEAWSLGNHEKISALISHDFC